MATPAQIDEQVQFERDAVQCGIDRLYRNTKKSEDKQYASSSEYGLASIKEAQSVVADEILSTFWKISKGQNGKHYADIHHYLSQFFTEEQVHVLANIALKRTFDLVFSTKKKDGKREPNTAQNVTIGIGHAVEGECQIRWYEQQDPELLARIKKKYWLSTTGTEQKRNIARLMMNRRIKYGHPGVVRYDLVLEGGYSMLSVVLLGGLRKRSLLRITVSNLSLYRVLGTW